MALLKAVPGSQPAVPGGWIFREALQGGEEFEQNLGEALELRLRLLAGDIAQARLQRQVLALVQVALDDLLQRIQHGIDLRARVLQPVLLDLQVEDNHQQEKSVNNGGCQGVEVVVGGGDELADLIDEQPNANPAQDGACRVDPAIGDQQGQQGGDEEGQSPPQHVGDVEPLAAQPGVLR